MSVALGPFASEHPTSYTNIIRNGVMENQLQKKRCTNNCGVPSCNFSSNDGVSLFRIPREVLFSPIMLKKWSMALEMKKAFPKNFRICSQHFQEKDMLIPFPRPGIKRITRLVPSAVPSKNLAVSSSKPIDISDTLAGRILKRTLVTAKRPSSEGVICKKNHQERAVDPLSSELPEENAIPECEESSLEQKQTISEQFPHEPLCLLSEPEGPGTLDKCIQVNLSPPPFITFTALWDTDKKLNTMTGLPDFITLNTLLKACQKVQLEDKILMSIRERILLTMYKLKTNCQFAELAISFQISEKTAKLYFADTIQLLAKATKSLIYWQTKEETVRSFPNYLRPFPNVRTILDCTEMKTVSFHNGSHTLNVVIGLSPSGQVNYVSKVETGNSSAKAIFNLTDLLTKLEQGDAVMINKGFKIGDELLQAGIEIIRPGSQLDTLSKENVVKNNAISAAMGHVERRLRRLKIFKVLSEKVYTSVIPYIDDIITVICVLVNLNSPLQSDDKSISM